MIFLKKKGCIYNIGHSDILLKRYEKSKYLSEYTLYMVLKINRYLKLKENQNYDKFKGNNWKNCMFATKHPYDIMNGYYTILLKNTNVYSTNIYYLYTYYIYFIHLYISSWWRVLVGRPFLKVLYILIGTHYNVIY